MKRLLSTLRSLLMLVVSFASAVICAQETRTYYITDSQGSPVAATDATGNVTWAEDYLPYGERRTNAVAAQSNQRWFTAALQNPDTGLLYFGDRYMDPVQGRFTSIDPRDPSSRDGSEFNRYWYGKDNPYAYVDPNGGNPISPLDWYDFGHDNLVLIANESVWVAATALGNEGAAQVAIEEIKEARASAALSTIGVVSVIPGTARVLKAADRIEEGAEALKQGYDATKRLGGRLGGEAHRAKVAERAASLEAEGNTITAGGGRLPERSVITPEGKRRFPDISARSPSGRPYHENVGRSTSRGEPVARERRALEDITGTEPGYAPYDR